MHGALPYDARRAKQSPRGARAYAARLLAVAALLLAAWIVLGVLVEAREPGPRGDARPQPAQSVNGGDRGLADHVARGGGARATSS